MARIAYPDFRGEHATPQTVAGDCTYDRYGRKWKYVQVSATVVAGNVLTPSIAAETPGQGIRSNGTVTTGAAVDATTIIDTGGFTTSILTGSTAVGESMGHRIRGQFTTGGTGGGQSFSVLNRIDDNTADIHVESGGTTFSPDGKMVTATTSSSQYSLLSNTRVGLTTTIVDFAVGVAQWDITDENWSWILVEGPGYALYDTSVAALDVGTRFLVPGTEDGYCAGSTATTDEDEYAVVLGRADVDNAADCLIRAWVDTTNMWGGGAREEDFGRVGEAYVSGNLGAGPV